MNLPRIFASAVARRLAVVLVALALGWLGIGTARSQDNVGCYTLDITGTSCSDQGHAVAGVEAVISNALANGTCGLSAARVSRGPVTMDVTARRYTVGIIAANTGAVCVNIYRTWPAGKTCSTRPPTSGGFARVAADAEPASCDNGCAVRPGTQATLGVQLGSGGPMFYNMDGWLATGDVCTPEPQDNGGGNDGEQCATQDNLTQCVKPDGRHCATASNGKEHCWRIDEHGIKASGNEATTKAPENVAPKPPSLPPPNGGDWVQKAVSQITAAINGQTSTSTVTQYQSSYGTSGQGASGHGADGEGKGGSGSGSGLGGGSGSGSGSGDGDGDGDGDGPGSPGGQLGDLYTSDGKTVASVFQAFRSRVGDSPLIDAIGNFFSAQGGGVCPVFTLGASTYWEAMSFDGHCYGDFLAALQSIGWVLMAAAALLAAYWALS